MIDHIVLATPDLLAEVERFASLTGVRPAKGGSHVGLGTANYLVGLGGSAYLEIVGPDVDQPEPDRERPFGIDTLREARVVTWAVRTPDLDRAVATARAAGYDPGEPRAMSRRAADGTLLSWRLTTPASDPVEGVVPFLIDWGTTPHPTQRGLPMLALRSLEAKHPDPATIAARLAALDEDLPVKTGQYARLVVTLDGPITLT
jgi:hypothetical protein